MQPAPVVALTSFLLSARCVVCAGRWLQEYQRWLPRRRVPSYLVENDWIFVVDERWHADVPLQDVRGPLHAVPLLLNQAGSAVAMPTPPRGTIAIGGALRVELGTLVLQPVTGGTAPALALSGATVATVQALAPTPANAFGTNAATFPVVPPSMGPPLPARPRVLLPLGANAEEGFIDGAITYGAAQPPDLGIVLRVDGGVVRVRRVERVAVAADAPHGDGAPAYGGRAHEALLTEAEVDVPLTDVRGTVLVVTRALVMYMHGFTDGRALLWFERLRLAVGGQRQFRPPPDAVLDGVLARWAGVGDAELLAETRQLLRARIEDELHGSAAAGITREVVWKLCDPRHFLRLPRVLERRRWRYHRVGRDRRLILDVPLATMAEIREVLGAWNASMAWRQPPPAPTARGQHRARRAADPEYFVLTDAALDGAGVKGALLSYWVQTRTLVLRLLVARLSSARQWMGGSQLPPQPAGQCWSLLTGAYVAMPGPAKDVVDAHLRVGYDVR